MAELHDILRPDELDTIGEIMNISMGASATAVSTMLEKQVSITTPTLQLSDFYSIDSSGLEPAVVVKIKYVKGIGGTNITMIRKRDMHIMLNLLMGNDPNEGADDFEFDEMSMSAACEVMNQMMGASTIALSEILGRVIDINPPEAVLVETKSEIEGAFFEADTDEPVVAVSFKMVIKEVLDTTFTCFLTISLAKEIIEYVTSSMEEEPPAPEPTPEPVAPHAPAAQAAAPAPQAAPQAAPAAPQAPPPQPQAAPAPQAAPPQPQAMPQMPAQPQTAPAQPPQQPMAPPQPQAMPQMPQYSPQYDGYAQMPPGYGYPPQMQMPIQTMPQMQMPPVKGADFPSFTNQSYNAANPSNLNLNLLMDVHLDVSVVVGRAKCKIKNIMEFGQGTIIELDKQTGSPAELIVNGQLLAYGDVIVVGDNFGIRVTEIVGTKELLDSLGTK